MPKSRVDFWEAKLGANARRDKRNLEELDSGGWESMVIWECELKELDNVERRVRDFLGE